MAWNPEFMAHGEGEGQNSAHDGFEDPGARIMSCRRRWGEGSQNTALFGAEELNELLGKLTFDALCSKLRGETWPDRALLPAS